MPEPRTPRSPRLFELFCSLANVAFRYVENRERKNQYIGTYGEWPRLDWRDNGMPWFTNEHNAPKDYGDALRPRFHLFSSDEEPDPVLRNETSFTALATFIRTDERLGQYLRADLDIFETHLEVLLGDIVDRYIHINGTTTFDADQFLKVYLPVEHAMLSEQLDTALPPKNPPGTCRR